MSRSSASPRSEGRERIAIVDPQPVVRAWISSRLTSSGGWITAWSCGNASQALRRLEGEEPDLLITELRLEEGLDGLSLIKSLHRSHPDLRILVHTAHSEEFYAERSLRAGAMGYLHKNDPSYRLEEAVERILHGEMTVNERIRHQALRNASGDLAAPERSGTLDGLTDRELEILLCIARGSTLREAAGLLGISNSTAQVHANRIRRKLGFGGTLELHAFAAKVLPRFGERVQPEGSHPEGAVPEHLTDPDLVSAVQRFVERYP